MKEHVYESCVHISNQAEVDDDAELYPLPNPKLKGMISVASEHEIIASVDCVASANISSALNSLWRTASAGPSEAAVRSSILSRYGSAVSSCQSNIAELAAHAGQAISLTQALSTTAQSTAKTLSPRNTLALPTVTSTLERKDAAAPAPTLPITSTETRLYTVVNPVKPTWQVWKMFGYTTTVETSYYTYTKTTLRYPEMATTDINGRPVDPMVEAGKSFLSSCSAAGSTVCEIGGMTIHLRQ